MMSLTTHAAGRTARRNIAPEALEYVLTNGRRIQRTGVTFYFLGRRDLPLAESQPNWASRLEGTVVLMSSEGKIITVYRQRKALPAIRRKMKYRLDPLTKASRKDKPEGGYEKRETQSQKHC